MICYFTGTGNSQYAATKLLQEGEELVSIAEFVNNKKYILMLEQGERLGFVYPVYYGGLPSVVQKFLNHLTVQGKPGYTFAVVTCGAQIYGAGKMLGERLAEKNITLNAVYGVKMPDNYVVLYSIQDEIEEEEILEQADVKLDEIAADIEICKETPWLTRKQDGAMTSMMYPFYAHGRKTKKFWTDDSCVGCGVCEQRCPSKAIKLIDGKVTWVKKQCAHCMACARCNAIQYGKLTKGRRRYTHPMLRKKKACH